MAGLWPAPSPWVHSLGPGHPRAPQAANLFLTHSQQDTLVTYLKPSEDTSKTPSWGHGISYARPSPVLKLSAFLIWSPLLQPEPFLWLFSLTCCTVTARDGTFPPSLFLLAAVFGRALNYLGVCPWSSVWTYCHEGLHFTTCRFGGVVHSDM